MLGHTACAQPHCWGLGAACPPSVLSMCRRWGCGGCRGSLCAVAAAGGPQPAAVLHGGTCVCFPYVCMCVSVHVCICMCVYACVEYACECARLCLHPLKVSAVFLCSRGSVPRCCGCPHLQHHGCVFLPVAACSHHSHACASIPACSAPCVAAVQLRVRLRVCVAAVRG